MKQIADELMDKAEALSKDQSDIKVLVRHTAASIEAYRTKHPVIAGATEAAIGFTAIAIGASLWSPLDFGTKVPELIGAAFGAGVGGVAGSVVSSIGGIGVTLMGTGFGIPAGAVMAIGAGIGVLAGSLTGWFGTELSTTSLSLAEVLFSNISGAALVAFGCYMLFLALKDLWRAGGEFVSYLRTIGVNEISYGAQP